MRYLTGQTAAFPLKEVDLAKAMQQREFAFESVLERQSEYRSLIQDTIRWFAGRGEEFTADDVRQWVGDPPKGVSSNLVGALFNAASKAGLIRMVGYSTSARVIGHGNLQRRWIGVP